MVCFSLFFDVKIVNIIYYKSRRGSFHSFEIISRLMFYVENKKDEEDNDEDDLMFSQQMKMTL